MGYAKRVGQEALVVRVVLVGAVVARVVVVYALACFVLCWW